MTFAADGRELVCQIITQLITDFEVITRRDRYGSVRLTGTQWDTDNIINYDNCTATMEMMMAMLVAMLKTITMATTTSTMMTMMSTMMPDDDDVDHYPQHQRRRLQRVETSKNTLN